MNAALALALVGCDSPLAGTADTWTEDVTDDGDLEDVTPADACTGDLDDVEIRGQGSVYHEDPRFWLVEVVIDGTLAFPPVDLVQLEIWPDRGGPSEPGTYDVTPVDYAGCGLCLLLRRGCVPVDGISRCESDLVALSGSVEIVDLEPTGGMVSGVIHDAMLQPASIDWDSGSFATRLLDGEVICLDRVEFLSVVSPYPAR